MIWAACLLEVRFVSSCQPLKHECFAGCVTLPAYPMSCSFRLIFEDAIAGAEFWEATANRIVAAGVSRQRTGSEKLWSRYLQAGGSFFQGDEGMQM